MHPAPDDTQKSGIPRLAEGWDAGRSVLSPAEGFLLSRIDGRTPWALLRQMGGLPPEEADRCLDRWLSEGVVEVLDAGARADALPRAASDGVDASLDLPVAFQRRILEFEAALDRPYHELLGVDRGADQRAIKRAYFALSKQFHPDRYFRRNIGGFDKRLERIFKKLVEAYELLSDPATRAEIERSMQQGPPSEAAPEAAPGGAARRRKATGKWGRLERLRKQFQIPEEILAERRFKAGQFYQAAKTASRKERWLEAAASVRLAIAFDPWNREYKEAFGAVQARVHQVRADALLAEGNASWDEQAQHQAFALYEEALAYRPNDAEASDRAAQLAVDLGELEKARDHAETACRVRPDVAAYRVTLARVFQREGLLDKARGEFDEALRLDPTNEKARAGREVLQRRSRRKR